MDGGFLADSLVTSRRSIKRHRLGCMTKIGFLSCFVLIGSYLKAVINSCGDTKLLQKVVSASRYDFQELLSFQDDGPAESLPYTLHGYQYYNRKTSSDFLPLFCRKKVGTDDEEVILNLDKEFPEG